MTTEECFFGPAIYHTKNVKATKADILREAQLLKASENVAVVFANPEMKRLIMRTSINNSIQVVQSISNMLQKDESYSKIKLRPKVFEWSFEEFQNRINMSDVYVDVLRTQPPRAVDLFKFDTDLNNLEFVLKMIYNQKVPEAINFMRGCSKVINIRDHLMVLHKFHEKSFKFIKKQVETFAAFDAKETEQKLNEVYDVINHYREAVLVSEPVQNRYKLNTHLNNNKITKHYLVQTEQQLKEKLRKQKTKSALEVLAFTHTMELYTNQIKEYKAKITYWTNKYNNDNEKMSNSLNNTELKCKAIEMQWKDCIERIPRMREEIKQVKRRILLEEAERAEKIRLETFQRVSAKPKKRKNSTNKHKKK